MLRWLLVDLNSYFASVEQERRPALRGKPVGVVPVMADTTCCIAASYEAKKFGVKTGTLVREARRLCPGIQFVEADHRIYVEYHEAIVDAVESCLPVTSVLSIDEMACQLTGRDRSEENAVTLAKEVKRKILRVGECLTSSVGIAPNRFLAKVASDMQKPDGLTVIRLEDLPRKLFGLKLRDLPGIGPRMEQRLLRHRVTSVEQLCSLDSRDMAKIWKGVTGERFHRWLRGEDFDVAHAEHRTVGHSHVLPPEFRSEAKAYAVTQKLLQKAAVRLRKIGHWANRLHVSVGYVDQTKWKKDTRVTECQDTLTLMEALAALWKGRPAGNPMKVSVTLFDLVPESERTFSFFDDRKRRNVSQAMDLINAKHGRDTIYFGGIREVMASAPTRIAFTNIPDLES